MTDPRALICRWGEEAATLRSRYADHRLAAITEAHARELALVLEHQDDERLSLAEAARESGYSIAHLRRLVAAGKIPNLGRRGRPVLARGSIPANPHRKCGRTRPMQGDLTGDVARMVSRALRGTRG